MSTVKRKNKIQSDKTSEMFYKDMADQERKRREKEQVKNYMKTASDNFTNQWKNKMNLSLISKDTTSSKLKKGGAVKTKKKK